MKIINNRKCIITNQILPKDKMVRFVKTKSNEFYFDFKNEIKGKGAYMINDKNQIIEALNKRILNRSFKQKIELAIYKKLIEEVNECL
ncbi:MAG: YlxR family protein [Metamycoplasmataceae bacterium]